MADVLKLPVPTSQGADEHARADTQRNQQLFDWADALLKKFGLDKAVTAAKSIEQLRNVTLDMESAEITLAIRDALYPASGQRQEHFRGLRAGGLKQILKNRFAEMKKVREAALRRGKRRQSDWKGVLAFDEFAARVMIKQRPPFIAAPNTPWTDHRESQTRVWLIQNGINAPAGDVGRAVQ